MAKILIVLIGICTLAVAVCEIAIGVWLNALVLLSDGFHNLSDCAALAIALWASYYAKVAATEEFSYGHVRTEMIAALVNGVSMLALCLYITLDAIHRFISPESLKVGGESAGIAFIAIACITLSLNVVATIIFALVGEHSHHAHNHAHNDEEHNGQEHNHRHNGEEHNHSHNHAHNDEGHNDEENNHGANDAQIEIEFSAHSVQIQRSARAPVNHNIRALFLHFLADAISSVFVLITALLNYFEGSSSWVAYMDPLFSLLIVGVTAWLTIPFIRELWRILMQMSPIDVAKIRSKLCAVDGVATVHDLHIWQLVSGLTVATVHVDCAAHGNYEKIADEFRHIFHGQDIHSVTIQPEFNRQQNSENEYQNCCIDDCAKRWCCEHASENK